MTDTTTTEASTFVSPKDLAEAWGTDPKSVRRFLRGLTDNRAGKGGRWEISTDDVEALTGAWKGKATAKKFVLTEEEAAAEELEVDVTELTDELDDEIVDLEDIDDEV